MKLRMMLVGLSAIGSAVFLAFAADSGGPPAGPPEMPPARMIPGITVPDAFPGGCVDCHLNYTDFNMDTRISTLMKQWYEKVDPKLLETAQSVVPENVTLKGVHPKSDASLEDIPGACMKCHAGKVKKIPSFGPMLHKLHLAGGDDLVYLRMFQGECTHCHKLDRASGTWSIPSGPEK